MSSVVTPTTIVNAMAPNAPTTRRLTLAMSEACRSYAELHR